MVFSYKKNQTGFTLLELLVVIAVIGLLATIIMINLNSARDKAIEAKTKGILNQLRTSIFRLESDTGYYYGACLAKPCNISGATAQLKIALFGIVQKPIGGSGPAWPSCASCGRWPNQQTIDATWNSSGYFPDNSNATYPYSILDGWGTPVRLAFNKNDPSQRFVINASDYSRCPGITNLGSGLGVFLISYGKNHIQDCDDILLPIVEW